MKTPTCPVCQLKTCYPNPNGGHYRTCGKTCSDKLTTQNKPDCPICKKKKCSFDPKGGYFKTCSKNCHNLSQKKIDQQCKICLNQPCAKNPNGGFFPTCSKTCASKLNNSIPICPICKIKDCSKDINGNYYDACSKACAKHTGSDFTTLLDSNSKEFTNVKYQFDQKWIKFHPNVVSIIKLNSKPSLVKKYKIYQNKIANKMKQNKISNFKQFSGDGNELRRFHGCTQTCNLGLPNGSTNICQNGSKGCNVCGIIENGFMISKSGNNFSKMEFGNGIYLTSTSEKANKYTFNTKLNGYKS